mgnify:CR=1 FL=1
MAVVSSAEFLLRYPEFATTASALIDAVLAESEQDTPYDVWGDRQIRAIKALTAHRLTMQERGNFGGTGGIGGGGALLGSPQSLSVSQESQSVSFGSVQVDPTDPEGYKTTTYGTQYLKLRGSVPVTGFLFYQ